MMRHKVLFTSDVHGNEDQFKKFIDYAIQVRADTLIIGGDIAPKHFASDVYLSGQRRFLKERLPELLKPLKQGLPEANLFMMMGNDDCAANLDVLESYEPEFYQIMHGKRLSLTADFDIVGYAIVPITPFSVKDWEKYDLSDVPQDIEKRYAERKAAGYKLSGVKSVGDAHIPFTFSEDMEKDDSIQKDLSAELFRKDAGKTVYVFHSPPDDTVLDQLEGGIHAGSFAIRHFIDEFQPYLALHGHIHETVDISGKFREDIGKTVCLSSGNHNEDKRLAVLVFDLYALSGVERILSE
ncbi:MAG: metallophosphoesterase [Candidatus Woesearchaeota archaeon]